MTNCHRFFDLKDFQELLESESRRTEAKNSFHVILWNRCIKNDYIGKHQVRIFRSSSKPSVKSDLRVPLHSLLTSVPQVSCIPMCFTELNNIATWINNSRRSIQPQQIIDLENSCFSAEI